MVQPRSRQELYEIIKNEIQSIAPSLTDFEEGSINDAYVGAAATGISELMDLILLKFKNTFFKSADGPLITGGPDDLETLAVDHFGDDFARPAATKSVGVVTFSRPTAAAGDVIISQGTIVKTEPDVNGQTQSFTTLTTVTMTGLSINASVEAVVAGPEGNVDADTVIVIETTLTDPSIVVTNDDPMAGGAEEEDDDEYRQTILDKIQELGGATLEALEAKLNAIPGIEQATIIEFAQNVIEWDDDTETEVGDSFTIPRVKAFISDANGTANQALIDIAEAALLESKACGVRIDVYGAVAVNLNWTATISLNPSGPNFAEFQTDTAKIEQTMREYLQDLEIGEDFNKGVADLAMMALWGPDGTDDLTDFDTINPVGNVVTAENERIIPGTMLIS